MLSAGKVSVMSVEKTVGPVDKGRPNEADLCGRTRVMQGLEVRWVIRASVSGKLEGNADGGAPAAGESEIGVDRAIGTTPSSTIASWEEVEDVVRRRRWRGGGRALQSRGGRNAPLVGSELEVDAAEMTESRFRAGLA